MKHSKQVTTRRRYAINSVSGVFNVDESVQINNSSNRHKAIKNLISSQKSASTDAGFYSPQCQRLRISGTVLGKGGFGTVYMGYLEHQLVAIKKYHRLTKNNRARTESFLAEARATRLVHANVVKTLFCTSLDNNHADAFVVMECVSQVTLKNVIERHSFRPLCMRRRLRYALDMSSALAYIHQQGFVHLDVKPANVLITLPDDRCKLGDFGCSQPLDCRHPVSGVVGEHVMAVCPTLRSELMGTFAYRSPELFRGKPATAKADVYALGIVLWQLVSRQTPFYGERQHTVIFGVVASGLRPPANHNVDLGDCMESLYEQLFTECWSAEPVDRPSATDVQCTISTWLFYL